MRAFSVPLTLCIVAVCVLLALVPKANPLVWKGKKLSGEVAVACAVTYVSLRTVNAVLSTAQDVQVSGSLVVASADFKPLKWLEPVDDTVERTSELVFALAVLTGVLSVAMGPITSVGLLLLAGSLLGGIAKWRGEPHERAESPLLVRSRNIGLLLAFGLPLAFIVGAWLGDIATHAAWADATETLASIAGQAGAVVGEPGGGEIDLNALEKVRKYFSDATKNISDASKYFSAARNLWDNAGDLLNVSVTLAGVYLLRLVVMPCLLFLVMLRLFPARGVIQPVRNEA